LNFAVPTDANGWVLTQGGCTIYETDVDICVTDGRDEIYPRSLRCEFAYVGDATLTWKTFDIYQYYYADKYGVKDQGCSSWDSKDYIIVNNEMFCGVDGELERYKGYYYSYPYYKGSDNSFRPTAETFVVTGVTRFMFNADHRNGKAFGHDNQGFDICAPKPASSDEDDIDSMEKLNSYCGKSLANCDECRGEFLSFGNCKLRERMKGKCRNFKGSKVCDMIKGCRSTTNKRGKVKCKGKKHGLA